MAVGGFLSVVQSQLDLSKPFSQSTLKQLFFLFTLPCIHSYHSCFLSYRLGVLWVDIEHKGLPLFVPQASRSLSTRSVRRP